MSEEKSSQPNPPSSPTSEDPFVVPRPVTEVPPHNRFCDLVLTGGIASGVVYPWAIVELARTFRFRNIGGTSVGAMAAALAAGAEYGRKTGFASSFEVLRRVPMALAEEVRDGGRTRMWSLFQTNRHGRRLIELWGRLGRGLDAPQVGFRAVLRHLVRVYWRPVSVAVALAVAVPALMAIRALQTVPIEQTTSPEPKGTAAASPGEGLCTGCLSDKFGQMVQSPAAPALLLLTLVELPVAVLLGLVVGLWMDLNRGVLKNGYGLCKGSRPEDAAADAEGLVDWLHEGIQRSAGLDPEKDRPLTFRDLWSAPANPGAPRQDCDGSRPVAERSINLQMITTNLTHGRPYRLPLDDRSARLFFCPEELKEYFPAAVLGALERCSALYKPAKPSDTQPAVQHPPPAGLRELPYEDLPVVVAARLSLSYPLLFSAVPLWAMDGEGSGNGAVRFRRCWFSDGGISSNFPVHLFDAAVPRWPTFGLWLDRRVPSGHSKTGPSGDERAVWLPDAPQEGREDTWNSFSSDGQSPNWRTKLRVVWPLFEFLGAVGQSAIDWRDRSQIRQPHVLNRVARLRLLPGEGGLHIGMPRLQILRAAHRYGTVAGRMFVERFADPGGQPTQAWSEQRWIRFRLLVDGLRERLHDLARSAAWPVYTQPLEDMLSQLAEGKSPARGQEIARDQAQVLDRVLKALEELGPVLDPVADALGRHEPTPELRIRPPL